MTLAQKVQNALTLTAPVIRQEYLSLQWVQSSSNGEIQIGTPIAFQSGSQGNIIHDGSITARYDQFQRRTCTLSVVNTSGYWTPGGANLSITSMFDLSKYVLLSDGTYAQFPLGRFMVGDPTASNLAGKQEAKITGYDKWRRYTRDAGAELTAPFSISSGSDLYQTIQSLAQQWGETRFNMSNPSYSIPSGQTWPEGTPVEDVLKWLANLPGNWELFYDVYGYLTFRQRVDPLSDASVTWNYLDTDRLKIEVQRTPEWSKLYNTIVVTGAPDANTVIRSVKQDLNYSNPYNANPAPNGIGQRVRTIVGRTEIWDQAHADARAQWELQRSIALQEKVALRIVPNHSHNEGDIITVRDSATGASGKYQILEVTYPAKIAAMSAQLWRARSFTLGVQ